MMRKCLMAVSMVGILAMMGCATSRELEKVQTEGQLIGAKADQALRDAQAAKTAADAARQQADAAAARAENAVKMAEAREQAAAEKEKAADEKAARAEAAFQKSMRK